MLGEDANYLEFLHYLGFFFSSRIEVKLSNKHEIVQLFPFNIHFAAQSAPVLCCFPYNPRPHGVAIPCRCLDI